MQIHPHRAKKKTKNASHLHTLDGNDKPRKKKMILKNQTKKWGTLT